MKYLVLVVGIVLSLLFVIGEGRSLAYTPNPADDSQNKVMSPQGIWHRYYNTSENQNLQFTDYLDETGWIIIDPCQDSECWAPDEIMSPPLPIPSGSTFPFKQSDPNLCNAGNNYCENVVNYVGSNFSWTPTYCQAGNYTFKSEHYIDSLWVDTIIFHVNVNNVNRLPIITSFVPDIKNTAVGQSLKLQLNATDIDKTQCGDDQVNWTYFTNYTGSKTFSDNGNGTAEFSLGPVNSSNIGNYTITFKAYDNYNGTSNKTMNIVIYQPSNGPSSCVFNKKLGGYVCA